MAKNYYDILGVNKTASQDEIKKAYRKLAMKLHPDHNTDANAKEKFAEVNEAYSVLSDETKRKNYDLTGDETGNSFGSKHGNPFDHFDPFSSFASDFGFNPFQAKYNKPDPNAPINGRNVHLEMNLSFKESIFGVIKDFDINIDEVCHRCNGSGAEPGYSDSFCPHCHGRGMSTERNGFVTIQRPCTRCSGTGRITEHICAQCNGNRRTPSKKHLTVNIPAGVTTGMKIRVPGKGQCGINNGINGDLFINVFVETNDLFTVDKLDLHTKIFISPIIASIGGEVDVYSPFGNTRIKIPAGTTNGKQFRIRGKGIKATNSDYKTYSGTGDLILTVEIEPLTNLTVEQKTLLNQLQTTLSEDNLIYTKQLNRKIHDFAK